MAGVHLKLVLVDYYNNMCVHEKLKYIFIRTSSLINPILSA